MLHKSHRHLKEIDSTNDEAMRWGREGAPHGAFVTADLQTAGRGRRGRVWSSPSGSGLYLSVLLRPDGENDLKHTHLTLETVPKLNFVACLATARAVHELTGHTCHTKWPNDVLLNGRKIAGVLSEVEMRDGILDFVVVGIGININQSADELPERPLYPASSLWLQTQHRWPVGAVLQGWLHDWWVYYHRLMEYQWSDLRDEFWRRCAQRGQVITIQQESGLLTGRALALDNDGALLLETPSGRQRILAGDILATAPSQ